MRVLGIDPGTAACGYGLVETAGRRLRALDYGWWSTSPRTPIAQRLQTLHDAVEEQIALHQPDAVALEESYVGVDARAALSLGQARGAILVACATAEVACTEYTPTAVKLAVCGYGRADKGQVQRMVHSILRLTESPEPTHAADALAVAICHALAPPLLQIATARA